MFNSLSDHTKSVIFFSRKNNIKLNKHFKKEFKKLYKLIHNYKFDLFDEFHAGKIIATLLNNLTNIKVIIKADNRDYNPEDYDYDFETGISTPKKKKNIE